MLRIYETYERCEAANVISGPTREASRAHCFSGSQSQHAGGWFATGDWVTRVDVTGLVWLVDWGGYGGVIGTNGAGSAGRLYRTRLVYAKIRLGWHANDDWSLRDKGRLVE